MSKAAMDRYRNRQKVIAEQKETGFENWSQHDLMSARTLEGATDMGLSDFRLMGNELDKRSEEKRLQRKRLGL